MNRNSLAKIVLITFAVMLLLSSCSVQTPGATKVAGIGVGGFSYGAYLFINLAVIEVRVYLGNQVGIGIVPFAAKPLGPVSGYIPWVPGVAVQILPVLFRNVTHKPFIGFIHLIIIKIGI